jgi:hypothetical protein
MFFKQLARGYLLKQGIIFEAQIKDLYRVLKTRESFSLKRKTSLSQLYGAMTVQRFTNLSITNHQKPVAFFF